MPDISGKKDGTPAPVGWKKHVAPPAFLDGEEQWLVAILRVILLMLMAAFGALAIFMLLWGNYDAVWGLASSILCTGCALWLAGHNHLHTASMLLAITLLAIVTILSTGGQGIHDVTLIAYPAILVGFGLLLPRISHLILALLTIAAVGWLVFGATAGLYEPQPHNVGSLSDFVVVTSVLLITSVSVQLLTDNLRQSLKRSHQETKERKQAEAEARLQAARLMAASELAIECAAAGPEANLLAVIANKLQAITGALAVTISSYDPQTRNMIVRYVAAPGPLLSRFNQLFGLNLIGMELPLSEEMRLRMLSEIGAVTQSLTEMSFGAIPQPLAAAIQKAFGIADFTGLAFVYGNELIGSAMIVMRNGQEPLAPELAQVLAHITAVSLRRQQAEEELRKSEERYALAARGANDGLWDWDLVSNTIFFSPRWKTMLGYPEHAIGSAPEEWLDRIHPDDREPVQLHLEAHSLRLVDRFEIECRVAHHDGGYHWMLCRGLAVWDADNRATRIVGSQTDITDHKLAEERLRHEALHDVLTGLPNRTLFLNRLLHALQRLQRPDHTGFAVLFIDLDRFKTINDSLGHLIGDHLLVAVARTLEGCLRPGDTVARLGGDEFTVLLEGLAQPQEAIFVAERIQQALSVPIHLEGQEIFTSASIGIALGSSVYQRPEELLRDADAAMYQAKLRGKACYAIFDHTMHTEALALLQLDSDLRRALARHELRLHYQPIISLQTGMVAGFEALVRWQHPEQGLLLPGVFLPLAEDTGLITTIGQWGLEEACRQLACWQARMPDLPPLMMSVNLSPKQLAQPGLVEQVSRILQETGLMPQQLALEIIESTLINVADARLTLERLRELGVRLSIDDFGTGYSALSYLHQFPVSTLKIDRSFVSRLGSDKEYSAIITAIIAMAQALDMEVVAEGVETPEQHALLQQLECGYGQGWLFAHPLDGAAVEAFIAETAMLQPFCKAVCSSTFGDLHSCTPTCERRARRL